jgi:hypothetical protein
VVDRGEPEVSCSEWHEDGTARENDRGSDLTATVPARAMGEARPDRHKLVGSPPQQGAAALTLTACSWLNPVGAAVPYAFGASGSFSSPT